MKQSNCSKVEGNLISGLSEFLHVLASHHLQELAAQCDLKVANKEKDRSQAIKGVLQYLEEHPEKPLRLRGKGKKQPQAPKFEKEGIYVFGINPPYLRPVANKEAVVFELIDNPLLEILLFKDFLQEGHGLPCLWFLPGAVVTGPWTIPANTTVITNLPYLRFEGGLTMERGAKLYGQHHCGLRLMVSKLHGQDVGAGGRPLVSTSIRPVAWNVLADQNIFEPIPAAVGASGDLYLYKLRANRHLPTDTTGEEGHPGSDAEPRAVVGSPGKDGTCDLGAPYQAPGDGESVGDGSSGGQGEDGGTGYLPAPLTIRIAEGISGVLKFRFDASGGKGGRGGMGGAGQSVYGGAGGNLSRWCWWPGRSPGRGGSAGEPGDGGHGGRGGSGGNGGYISLSYPQDTNETLFGACVKGGDGGEGGQGGYPPGVSYKGGDGLWIDIFGNPEGDNVSMAGTALPVLQHRGELGQVGGTGSRGVNGRIVVNGRVVVPGGSSSQVAGQYCYPDPGSGEC